MRRQVDELLCEWWRNTGRLFFVTFVAADVRRLQLTDAIREENLRAS